MKTIKTLTVVALAAAALAATVGSSQAKISCFACNLPRPHQPGWGHGHGPHWPYPGRGWGYGHHDHWGYGWYRRHPVYFGGAPVAPVAVAPSPAPTGSCNCLTKQTLPNGSVMFADICTQQSAIVPPPAVGAR